MSAPNIYPDIPPSTPCFTHLSHSPGCNLGLLSAPWMPVRLFRRGGNGLAGHSTMTYYSIHGDLPIHTSSSPECEDSQGATEVLCWERGDHGLGYSGGDVAEGEWPILPSLWGSEGSNDIMGKKLLRKTSQTSKGLFLLGNTIWTPNGLLDIAMNKNSFVFLPGGPLPSSNNITPFLQVGWMKLLNSKISILLCQVTRPGRSQ